MDQNVEAFDMALPLVSIIIPCYNAAKFLPEALASVQAYRDDKKAEVIIVNDGSTDAATLALLNNLLVQGYQVLHQENKGPAGARNTGIAQAQGQYLLFLDSDNKVKPGYLEEGIAILKANSKIGVVYSNPHFFGDVDSQMRFRSRKFEIKTLLASNYIDMCSIVRTNACKEAGGFDENRLLIGHEDYELWIRLYKAGWGFHYINKQLFEYRVRNDSLIKEATTEDRYRAMLRYVYAKHLDVFIEQYQNLYLEYEVYQFDKKAPFRSFVKYLVKKYGQRTA